MQSSICALGAERAAAETGPETQKTGDVADVLRASERG